ncbi:hypothetical protein ACVWXM_002516 [Bradyrhizobium sp. GM7.3]
MRDDHPDERDGSGVRMRSKHVAQMLQTFLDRDAIRDSKPSRSEVDQAAQLRAENVKHECGKQRLGVGADQRGLVDGIPIGRRKTPSIHVLKQRSLIDPELVFGERIGGGDATAKAIPSDFPQP